MRKYLIALTTILTVALFAVPALAAPATNPFMDVPANHWAYDAISQLASRGVISGYPDGSFKGAQPSTRYEMASIVARALAKVDMEKANKQDVELLKKLVLEFKDELDALGVKVDKVDSRLAVMEKDLGGWSLAGELRFDAKFSDSNAEHNWYSDDAALTGKNEFDLNRYRFWIRKRIDENTSFTARLGSGNTNNGSEEMVWEHYYITTKLPYDITLDAGRYNFDWESDLGFYNDNDAWVGDITANLFHLTKSWGLADLQLVVGRNGDDGSMYYSYDESGMPAALEQTMIAGRADFNFNEKFRAGLLGYYFMTDENPEVTYNGTPFEADSDYGTYGAYFGYKPAPSIELKGLYYYQTQDDGIAQYMSGGVSNYDDTASAWKAIVDVKQDALKFTGLWLEYGQIDNNFLGNSKLISDRSPFANSSVGANPYAWGGAEILRNQPNNMNTTKIMLAYLPQQWNDKWRTYLRYVQADFDTSGLDDATGWTIGVAYRLNPSVEFELSYDAIDYGDGMVHSGVQDTDYRNGDDSIVRFRTYVTF